MRLGRILRSSETLKILDISLATASRIFVQYPSGKFVAQKSPRPDEGTKLSSLGPDSRLFVQEANEIGDISDRDTPVPIPNTEVKPVRADGTNAQFGVGRVGRRRSHPLLER